MSDEFYERQPLVNVETPDFDAECRSLLGVEDQSAPVEAFTEHDMWDDDGEWVSYDAVTISCAGVSLTIEGQDCLARLIRRLDHALDEKPSVAARRLLGARAAIHTDSGQTFQGSIIMVTNTWLYLLSVKFPEPAHRKTFRLTDIVAVTAEQPHRA